MNYLYNAFKPTSASLKSNVIDAIIDIDDGSGTAVRFDAFIVVLHITINKGPEHLPCVYPEFGCMNSLIFGNHAPQFPIHDVQSGSGGAAVILFD
ncbi:hypothetical protein SCUP234_12484 [Seiridium cupressi]